MCVRDFLTAIAGRRSYDDKTYRMFSARSVFRSAIVPLFVLAAFRPALAQSDGRVELVVGRGRPLRVALADSSTVRRVGQTVTATVVEPVYAYDRIVIPVGTQVIGRVATLDNPSKASRARAMLGGDFSPHRIIGIEFYSFVRDGAPVPMHAVASNAIPHVKRSVARAVDEPTPTGRMVRAKQEAKTRVAEAIDSIKQQAGDAIAAVKEPGRRQRLEEWAINRLPYHPQVLRKDTVYDAELQTPVTFGLATPRASAPEGSVPAPSSILTARLVTALDSARTPRGTSLEAVLAEPVFAEDGRLIFPEGTQLTGEVTYARQARRFHRNGQLRFLFERVQPPDRESAPLLASLHAIDASDDDGLVLDDEGGAGVTNSKSRFVAPALAILALRASADQGEGRGFEQRATNVEARTTHASVGSGNPLARGLGGFIGFGLLGAGLSQLARPLGIAFAAAGAARSTYSAVFGRGREVRFQPDTPIQVQLAPGRSDGR
jgi:type IV secretory pathway VirB10-like protein